jgi:hypothetical protein
MQAHVAYAFNVDQPLDLLELTAADDGDRKIFEASEPTENFLAPFRKADVIRMAPQTHKRSVEIKKQKPLIRVANARDYFRPCSS